MSSRLKQTKIDVATANPWTGASPGGGAAHLVRATGRAGRVRIRSRKRSATGRYTHSKNPAPFGAGFLLKRKTKSSVFRLSFLLLMPAVPYSHMGDPTLPSALRRFTSEFGMGSGGTTALVPPGKFFVLSTQFFIASAALPALAKSVTYFSMLLPFLRWSPCCCANYCVLNSESKLKIFSNRQNIFGVVRLSLTVH